MRQGIFATGNRVRTSLARRVGGSLRALIALAALTACCVPAMAQSGAIVACQATNGCPAGAGNSPYTDLQQAIDDAVTLSETNGQQVLVLVVGGPWTVSTLTIPADANIRIIGVPYDLRQLVGVVDADGGTFTLTFTDPATGTAETTAAIDWDATAAEVQAALEALTTIDAGDVAVTGADGGPFLVDFTAGFADSRMTLLVATSSLTNSGTGSPFAVVRSVEGPQDVVIQGGGAGPVVEIVAEDTATLPIAYNATAAEIEAALEGLDAIDPGDVSVTGTGPFTIDFTGGGLSGQFVPVLGVDASGLLGAGATATVVSTDPANNSTQELTITNATGGSFRLSYGISSRTDRLVIEGVAITGGTDGVQLRGFANISTTFAPVLNRCYIQGNNDNGVRVQDNGRPKLINCSISSNDQAGVYVGDGIVNATGAFADLLHCSLIDNGERGVYVEQGENARVRNTLVFQNGDGASDEGGLVWETNPFIDPDFGPVDGGTSVTITGANFGSTGNTLVYFGPVDKPGTVAANVVVNAAATQITCDTPPAWTGAPGPVDVYIVRTDDNFTLRVPNAFTYQADHSTDIILPVVNYVSPGWGPIDNAATTTVDESAIDVYVYGANFDPDCEVWFDWNGNGVINLSPLDGQSPRVRWLSSGLLLARVPTRTAVTVPARIDVLVRNVPTGEESLAGPLKDYEYRAVAGVRPEITAVVPDEASALDGASVLVDAYGANFADDCVVMIGGIVCTYNSVHVSGALINDIVVPISRFGGGGVYDVEVINPNGTWDVLPNAFTYFPTGEPGVDPATSRAWRVANFVEDGVGGNRQLGGFGFDYVVDVYADPDGVNVLFANNVNPTAQRTLPLTFPALATTIDPSLNVEVDIEAINDNTMPPGNTSTSTADAARATMYYAELRTNLPAAGEALYFEITSVAAAINAGNPDDLSVTILNYQTSMDIYVGDVLVDPADYTTAPADAALGGSATVVFPAPDQPEGVWGPVDIRVELPNGVVGENDTAETLYYMVENAYSYRRANQLPEVYAVTPDTVRDDQIVTLRITGANFLSMQNPDGSLNGIYTRAWIDADGTVANGNEIDLSLLPTYRVVSFSEIQVDIRLDDLDLAAAIIPRAPTAVGVRVEQYDSVGAAVLTSAGNPLSSYLSGVVTFIDGASAPQITNVANNIDGRPTGPVSGYDPIPDPLGNNVIITITGLNFGADEGQVLFGTAQALITSWADASIVVELPPAPAGLPGIYDVTVIKPDTAVPNDYRVATLRNGFTYYMDGTPFITEISPNHRADGETDDLFITIRGYNFDDVVDIRFDGTGTNDALFDNVRTISPTEIVIRAPLPDAISDPADFATNPVAVPVRLWNDGANLDETQATAANMISNDVDFYLHDDGRGNVTANLPTLQYNDVYDNVVSDYINVAAGAGSIAVDPGLLPGAFWLGKLVVNTVSAPLLSKAGPFTEGSYTLLDFEGDVRPAGEGAEIGADEISDFLFGGTLETFFWIFARPTPNPVGALDAGDLIVELQFTGDAIGPSTEVFIVPQGGEPLTVGDRIELELYQHLGAGRYLFQNVDDIETVVRDVDGSGGPTDGDIIADGHAAIYLQDSTVAGGRIFGYPAGDLTDGDYIQGQAIYGRHFLIDTVPPRMFVEAYTAGQAVAADLIATSDDIITALDALPATHPFPALPTGITADLPNGWTPSTTSVPSSYYGVLTLPPLAGIDGVKVFFNNGSIASNAVASPPPSNLTYMATVRFIDRPITVNFDPMGAAINGNPTDTDRFTGRTNRQVAGFLLDEAEPDNLDEGAGHWLFSTGASLLAAQPAPVTVAYATVDSGASFNFGVFDPSLIPGDGDYVSDPGTADTDVPNDELQAQWTVGPLDWNLANDNTFHIAGKPLAVDLAGNVTNDIDDYLTDPLHIWWIINTQSRLVPDREQQSTNRPNFTMQLDRSYDPQAEGGPVPIFTYRVYTSAAYAGVYNPVVAWTDWSPVTSIDDIQNIPGILGQWVLVICQAADEAGNVEPWAFDPLVVPPDGPIDLTDPVRDDLARALPNWMRFFYTDRDAPNTRVTHTIWYDLNDDGIIDPGEPNLGAARLAPLPGDINIPVRVEFLVSTVRPAGITLPIKVQWEFVDDGVLGDTNLGGYFGNFASDADVKRIVASFPGQILGANNPYLGDVPDRQRPITYVFRASAYVDDDNSNTFDPGAGEIIDQTPANVYFTVVPTGVANFIREPAGEDDQPIKEQEIR